MAAGFAYIQWSIYNVFSVSRTPGVISVISTAEETGYSVMAFGALLAAVGWYFAYWKSIGSGSPTSPPGSIRATRISAILGLVGFAMLGLAMAAYAGITLAGSAFNAPSSFPPWTGPALLSIEAVAASIVAIGWAWERGSLGGW